MSFTDIHKVCIFCGTGNSTPLFQTTDFEENTFHLESCHHCNAIFLNPRPDENQLAHAYDTDYYGHGEKKFSVRIEKFIDHYHRQRAKLITRYMGKSGTVLDIGCGSGRFLDILRKKGNFEIHGIELPGKAAERAGKIPGVRLKAGKISEYDYENNFFDAITLFHVFEHLDRPAETLRIISGILKPGGILVMAFPNIGSFQCRLFKGKWLHIDPPRHLFFFKPSDFKNAMKQYGFSVLRENYLNISNGFAFQQSILNCIFRKREVLYESLKGNRDYVKEFSRFNLMLQKIFFLATFPLFFASDVIESAFHSGATVLFVMRKK